MIHFDNVTKQYKGSDDKSLHGVSLVINPGEFVVLTGVSGAGKTTLLKMILGHEVPTEGSVLFDGDDIKKMNSTKLRKLRRKIGMVFQDFKLLPTKNAYENIAFALEISGRSEKEIKEIIPHILKVVNLEHMSKRFIHELSGGELQRLAIGRAIAVEPDVLMADEPTANLDSQATWEIIEILSRIHELGTTVLLSTHNEDLIKALKKRTIVLEEGKIIKDDHHKEKETHNNPDVHHTH